MNRANETDLDIKIPAVICSLKMLVQPWKRRLLTVQKVRHLGNDNLFRKGVAIFSFYVYMYLIIYTIFEIPKFNSLFVLFN